MQNYCSITALTFFSFLLLDTSDWDSTSISLKSTPCVKPSDRIMLEDHVAPKQFIETNVAPEISAPVKEDSDTQNIISSKGSKNQNFVQEEGE